MDYMSVDLFFFQKKVVGRLPFLLGWPWKAHFGGYVSFTESIYLFCQANHGLGNNFILFPT